MVRSIVRPLVRKATEIWPVRSASQVSALSVAGPFPLRWLSSVRDLRSFYSQRAAEEDGWRRSHGAFRDGSSVPLDAPLAVFLQNAGANVVLRSAAHTQSRQFQGDWDIICPFRARHRAASEADVDALVGDGINAVGVLIYTTAPDLGTRLHILKARLQRSYSVITIPYSVVEHCLLDPPSCAGVLAEFADRYLPGADLFDDRNAISDGLFFFGRTDINR